MDRMNTKKLRVPIGPDEISVVVAHEGDEPKTVIMSYGSFLELWATLYVAMEALSDAGVDPDVLAAGRLSQTGPTSVPMEIRTPRHSGGEK